MHKLGPGYGHNQSPESSKNSQPLFYPSKISNSTAFFSNFHVSLKLRIFVILFSFFPLSYLSSSSFFTRCLSLIPQTSNMVLLFSLSLSVTIFIFAYIYMNLILLMTGNKLKEMHKIYNSWTLLSRNSRSQLHLISTRLYSK